MTMAMCYVVRGGDVRGLPSSTSRSALRTKLPNTDRLHETMRGAGEGKNPKVLQKWLIMGTLLYVVLSDVRTQAFPRKCRKLP